MRGLLGSNDGNAANDLALRDGTVLAQPVAFTDLYGAFADSWRLNDATSFFEYPVGQGTADFTDLSFPAGVLSLQDIPTALLDIAEAAAAGITDPILRDAAIRDFLLSGNPDYIAAAKALIATPTAQTAPIDAPEINKGIGVFASDSRIVEGDDGATTLVYTIYRIGDLADPATLTYQINGEVIAYGSGSLSFAAGDAITSVSINITGDSIVEADDQIVFQFQTAAPGALILNSRVVTDLIDDDTGPVAKDDSFATGEDSTVSGNVLQDNGQGADTGDGTLTVTALIAPNGTELAVGQTHSFDFGTVTLNADGSFVYDPRGPAFDDLNAGATALVGFGYLVSDGVNSSTGLVDITVTGADEMPIFNEITGTQRRDFIRGTEGNDIIRSLGGFDVMNGKGGEDWFVFGDETHNCRREIDVIRRFNWQEDAIVLEGDAEVRAIKDVGYGVKITFEGDRDSVLVYGRGVEHDNILILQADALENWV